MSSMRERQVASSQSFLQATPVSVVANTQQTAAIIDRNTAAIAASLARGGPTYIQAIGNVYIRANSLFMRDHSGLYQSDACTLKLADGESGNIVLAQNWLSPSYTLSGFTMTDASHGSGNKTRLDFNISANPGWVAGQYILIKGDTTEAINGYHRLYTVNGAAASIMISGRSSVSSISEVIPTPTGTITAQLGNMHAIIQGGEFDYNIQNNGGTGYLGHALQLNKFGNLKIRDTRVIADTYGICLTNCEGVEVDRVWFDSQRDGVHLQGWTRRVTLRNLKGQCEDDFVAWTANNDDGYNFMDLPAGSDPNGDLVGLHIDGIQGQFKNFRVLINPKASYEASGILIENYFPQFDSGKANSGVIGNIYISNESNANAATGVKDVTIRKARVASFSGANFITIGGYGANCGLEKLLVEDVISAQGGGLAGDFIRVTGAMTVGDIHVKDCNLEFTSNSSAGQWLNAAGAGGVVVGNYTMTKCKTRTSGTLGGDYSNWLRQTSTAQVNCVTINNCELTGRGHSFDIADKTKVPVVVVDGATCNGAAALYSSNKGLDAAWLNCKVVSASQAPFNLWGSGSLLYKMKIKNLIHSVSEVLLNASTTTTALTGGDETVKTDITKLNRAGSAGAICMHNGATTAGTVVANNLVVCDATGAANSFKQMSAPANAY